MRVNDLAPSQFDLMLRETPGRLDETLRSLGAHTGLGVGDVPACVRSITEQEA